MKTEVKITIVVEHNTDEEYEDVMSEIETTIGFISGVESVDVGIGETE